MRTRSTLAALVIAACLPATAGAQDPVSLGNFNTMRFSPAPGPGNYAQVDGAQTPGDVSGSVGLVLDYAHRPLVLYDVSCDEDGQHCETTGTRAVLSEYLAVGYLTGTVALFDHLQIGLVLPLALTNGDGLGTSGGGADYPSGLAFAVADPRLTLKGRFFTDEASGASLGASAYVTAPLGNLVAENRFVGDLLPNVGGQLIFEVMQSGFRLAVNAGGVWRDQVTFLASVTGPQLTYGLGVGYDFSRLGGLFAELVGASTFTDQVDEHYLEWRLGGRLRVGDFDMFVAGGSGLPPFGVGTPQFRALAGFSWAPAGVDQDGDGVDDGADQCPGAIEDRDGWEDEDGCPDPDNDNDGLDDREDRCPDQAEDLDEFEDADGCPDVDNDGDGIHDGYDSCPNDAEDVDQDRDEDGCPDQDTDGDSIADADDRCPDEAEDFDGWGDEDGCPETDFDEDGVPDDEDQCPDAAEDRDGFEDEDGCAEEGEAPAGDAPRRGRRRRHR